jgi:hypothetical protein
VTRAPAAAEPAPRAELPQFSGDQRSRSQHSVHRWPIGDGRVIAPNMDQPLTDSRCFPSNAWSPAYVHGHQSRAPLLRAGSGRRRPASHRARRTPTPFKAAASSCGSWRGRLFAMKGSRIAIWQRGFARCANNPKVLPTPSYNSLSCTGSRSLCRVRTDRVDTGGRRVSRNSDRHRAQERGSVHGRGFEISHHEVVTTRDFVFAR